MYAAEAPGGTMWPDEGAKGTLEQIISYGLERVKHNENNPFTFRLYA